MSTTGTKDAVSAAIIAAAPKPPPTKTLNPSSPFSFRTNLKPRSWILNAVSSSFAPLMAILNLPGSHENSGCRLNQRLIYSQYGLASSISPSVKPDKGSAVIFLVALPLVWIA